MNRFSFLTLIAITAYASPPASAGQLDLMRSGKLQCYSPNVETRTCAALAGYTFSGNSVTNQAWVLLSPNPIIVMSTSSPVTFSGETICGPLRHADIESATFTINGQSVAPDVAGKLRAQMLQAMAPRLEKQICTTYAPSGNGYVTQITVDGVADASDSSSVSVVGPKDGYVVGPTTGPTPTSPDRDRR